MDIASGKTPECDGIELARRVRAMCPDLDIVLVAGGRMEERQAESLRCLGVHVERTPLDVERFLAVIESIAVCRTRKGTAAYVPPQGKDAT
jgi:CheY-like chemotaxis protein